MLRTIGACCLALSLASFAASPLGESLAGSPETLSELADKLLRLHDSAAGRPDGKLLSEEAAEILLRLVSTDQPHRTQADDCQLSTSILLRDLLRLADRVTVLEAELQTLPVRPDVGPFVRITVARSE